MIWVIMMRRLFVKKKKDWYCIELMINDNNSWRCVVLQKYLSVIVFYMQKIWNLVGKKNCINIVVFNLRYKFYILTFVC